MAKTQKFSIYLLKPGFGSSKALKQDHALRPVAASNLGAGWKMFVTDAAPKQPWWKGYFGVAEALNQSVQGGLVFLKVGGRNFALSFGTGHNKLKDESYEYDFGLRVTLNCVDPELIRNTDVLDPSTARRQRTQTASMADLTFFEFDGNSSILRTLTGSSRQEYTHLTKHVTGASNLKIGSNRPISEIPGLLKELLDVYAKDTYKTAFPDLQNIVPVRDPAQIAALDLALMSSVHEKDDGIILTIPSIINYNENFEVMFGGAGASKLFEDADMRDYFGYLAEHGIDVQKITLADLKHHELRVADENAQVKESYSVYRSLAYETSLPDDDGVFHLNEGQWYRVEPDFIKELSTYLDPRCVTTWLPKCEVKDEGDFNAIASAARLGAVNLDKSNVAPKGQTQLEPCDIYSVVNGQAVLTHVKIGTDSSVLSHLFAQGENAVTLLRVSDESRENLAKLVDERGDTHSDATPISTKAFSLEYAIVTKKDPALKSANLPFFSRLTLRRAFSTFELMGVDATYGFVADEYGRANARKKPRKKKAAST